MMLKLKGMNLKTDHRGIALITVLIIMLVLTILSTGVVIISVSNLNQTKTTLDHSQSYYVAEAGVNYVVKKFEDKVDGLIAAKTPLSQVLTALQTWDNSFADVALDLNLDDGSATSGKFIASVSVDTAMKTVNITSTGTVEGVSRTLVKTIQFSGLLINKAILTEGNLYINMDDIFMNTSTVLGEVQTLTNGPGTVDINQLAKVGIVWIPTPIPTVPLQTIIPDCETLTIVNGKNMCTTGNKLVFEVKFDDTIKKPLPPVILPTFPAYTSPLLDPITNSVHYKQGNNWNLVSPQVPFISSTGEVLINSSTIEGSAYIASGYEYSFPVGSDKFFAPSFRVEGTVPGFTFNVGDRDIEIITNSFFLAGSFNIKGTGSLTIFVDSAAKFTTDCNNKICGAIKEGANPQVADKFILVVDGATGTELSFSGNGTFYISIITKLSVNFNMTGTWTFNGFLSTGGGSVSLGGTPNGNMLIYAPDATVNMNGNAELMGAIYAASYISNGNSVKITYSDLFSNPPFDFLNPLSNMFYGSTIEN